jgi:predicted DNA-binding transcriptional regulator YafY
VSTSLETVFEKKMLGWRILSFLAMPDKLGRYKTPIALERLLLLIAVLINYPGVGCRGDEEELETGKHHQSLAQVQSKIRELAKSLNVSLKPNYPAIPTIRKDLETLRDWNILERRIYRWGYYLGTGVMSKEELKAAFDAIASQAIYQGDPRLRQIHRQLVKRLRGLEFTPRSDFFYPVRQHLNRAINYTDPDEMMLKGECRHTLYHHIDKIEQAIVTGQAIQIERIADLYGENQLGRFLVWPLQLIYYDIAWYLLCESCSDGLFSIGRINRFSDYCKIFTPRGRSIEAQKQSLKMAYQLLENGWGLKLGNLQEQKLELDGRLDFVPIKVRFYPPVSSFIAEGELRHPKQKLRMGVKDAYGKPQHLDYLISLPPRSLDEFGVWVQRYADKALVLSPKELVTQHREQAIALYQRYNNSDSLV